MSEQPNIKLEVLRFVLESDGVANLREFARENNYEEDRVARKSIELSPLLEYGVSPMVPWIPSGQEDAVEEQIAEWEKHD